MINSCLLIHDKYIKLILSQEKTWEIRTKRLFSVGERIALGNTKTKLIEGYATVADVKKKTVAEMMMFEDRHFANDFIAKRWSDRSWLYAFVLSDVESASKKERYPPSHGNPKVPLS